MRRDRRAVLGALAAVATAGCVGGAARGPGEDADYDVGMSAAEFLPDTIEIQVDETVVWRNTSSHAHTVTAYETGIPAAASYFASGGFESEQAAESGYLNELAGSIYSGETYSHRFTVPGRYEYFCIPHEAAGMTGVVTVRE